jgi:protein-disulfide isomerase
MKNGRSSLFAVATLLAMASVLMGASCSGSSQEQASGEGHASGDEHAAPAGPRVETIPGVDISELTGAERRIWVDIVNEQLSPCGDAISVARCATADQGAHACRRCVPASRYVARLIGEGYERSEIEDLYDLRYGHDTDVEVPTDGFPTRGAVMARVTIVEFSDFQCPHCGHAHPILRQLLREFEGDVRLVFRNYPLPGHPRATPAARAAIAAGNQDKFWEMADLLFEHQDTLEDEDIDRYATELGLDMARFHTDLASSATQARIDADREAGHDLDVEGTPTFFINGRRFHEPPSSLANYVREELDQ